MNRAMSAMAAIPAQCKKCGELFDLSYDLEGMGEDRYVVELLKSTRNPKTALCWKCRQEV